MATGNSASIDSLELDIQYKATKAADQINKLAKALTNLKKAASDLQGLNNVLSSLKGFDGSFSGGTNSRSSGSRSSKANIVPYKGTLAPYLGAIDIKKLFGNYPPRRLSVDLNSIASAAKNAYINIRNVISGTVNFYNDIKSFISLSTDYIENMNLFSVSMGKYADEAREYAEAVSEAMGIDPSEWMRNQGIFMTLATGFGIVSDRAYIMSKNLTQLGYDISSFFNIDYAEAMQKLQSGISGELEPLRRLGYDISQAKLEATALSLGINKLVKEMTQAEKAELRYYAIMTQVKTVQGDMARTLEQPANQIRVFEASIKQAARAIANIFVPIINKLLPYLTAFSRVIRDVANVMAQLTGFTIPEVDYENNSFGEISADMEEATESAKSLNKQLASFDEINNITITDDIDTNNGSGSDFGFTLPEYDFIGEELDNKTNKIYESLKQKILPIVQGIADNADLIKAAILTIGAANTMKNVVSLFGRLDQSMLYTRGVALNQLKPAFGIAGLVGGFMLAKSGAEDLADYLYGDGDSLSGAMVKLVTGGASAIVGGFLIGGPIGAVIGALLGIGSAAWGMVEETQEALKSKAIENFSNESGASLDTIKRKLAELVEPYENWITKQQNANTEISTAKEKVNELSSDLSAFLGALAQREKITSDDVSVLAEKLDALHDAAQNLNDLNFQQIFSTIGEGISMGLEDANGTLSDMYDKFLKVQELSRQFLLEDKEKIISIYQNAADENRQLTDEEQKEVFRLQQRMTADQYDGLTSMASLRQEFLTLREKGLSEDITEASQQINGIADKINQVMEDISLVTSELSANYASEYSLFEAQGIAHLAPTPLEYDEKLLMPLKDAKMQEIAAIYAPLLYELMDYTEGKRNEEIIANKNSSGLSWADKVLFGNSGYLTVSPVNEAYAPIDQALNNLADAIAQGGNLTVTVNGNEDAIFDIVVEKNNQIVSATGQSPIVTPMVTPMPGAR